MGKDPFEEIVSRKRDLLDHAVPPEKIWERISQHSFEKREHPRKLRYWQVAAMILLTICIGLIIHLIRQPAIPHSLSDLSPTYAQLEKNYVQQINQAYRNIPIDTINHSHYQWLFDELAYLDTIRETYLKDLPMKQSQDKVIEVLVDYYEKKLKLLKKLELEINRQQHEKEHAIS